MAVKQGFALFLMIWNLVVFLVYGLDKGKARKGSYRISEKTLLMMTYVGGDIAQAVAAVLKGFFNRNAATDKLRPRLPYKVDKPHERVAAGKEVVNDKHPVLRQQKFF